MNITSVFTIIIIALSLSIDAFIVSIAAGITLKKLKLRNAFKIAFIFGFFQALMPLLGWCSGNAVRRIFETIEYYVVAGIFFLIGLKMMLETFLIEEEEEKDYTSFKILIILGIATSIDAFAAGLGFSILHVSIILPITIIGLVTFSTSFLGVYIGNRSGKAFGDSFSIAGGIILIMLGFRFLLKALEVW